MRYKPGLQIRAIGWAVAIMSTIVLWFLIYALIVTFL
jgi:hypothetical protein